MSYSRDIPPMWYEESTSPVDHMDVVVKGELILEPIARCALVKWHVNLEQLEVEWGKEAIIKCISDGLVSDNA